MTISSPDPMRDPVQAGIADEERWSRELDTSLLQSLAEADAGQGIDLDVACSVLMTALLGSGGTSGNSGSG